MDIKKDFSSAKGFYISNLKNMFKLYKEYSKVEIVQTASAQIAWSHNLEILKIN